MAQNDDGKDLPDDFSQDMEKMLKERINEWTPPQELAETESLQDLQTKPASVEDSTTSSSPTSGEIPVREKFVRPSDALDADGAVDRIDGVDGAEVDGEVDGDSLPVDPTIEAPEHRQPKPKVRLNLNKPYVEHKVPTSDPTFTKSALSNIPPAYVTEGEIRSVGSVVWPQEHIVETQVNIREELSALFIKTDKRADSMPPVEIQKLINQIERVQIKLQEISHALHNKRDKKLAKATEFELAEVDLEKSKGRPRKTGKPKRESDPDKPKTDKAPSFPSVKVADRNAYRATLIVMFNSTQDVADKVPGMLAKFAVNPELKSWFDYEFSIKGKTKIPETT